MDARRLGRRILVGVAGASAVIAAALLFAQDQETLRLRSALAAADQGFAEYAAALTGAHVTRGDRYEVLQNGSRIFPPMLEAIARARRRINLETYIYDQGAVAERFTAALAAAARRGVAVRVIVDAVGAATMAPEHAQTLRQAGVELAQFNALHWYSIEEVNYRTHRKILVVDGEVGFVGGAGFADHWQGDAAGAGEWRDTHLRVEGPAVARLEAAFYENWAETGHVAEPALEAELQPRPDGGHSLVTWSSPTGGANAVKVLYLLSIAAARRTVDIQTPYFVIDESSGWAIEEARRRGVRVRLLLEGDMTDARSVKYAGRAHYERLLASGVEIHEFVPTMMHVKATVIDGAWSLVGSANFDNRSFELNDEVTVAVADAGLAGRLTADFERDLRRSRRITAEQWQERGLAERTHERFWSLFGELF